MQTRSRATTTLFLLGTLCVALGPMPGAQAQCTIPENIVSAQTIDDSGRQAIRACVVFTQQAFAKDDAAVELARKNLVRPFAGAAPPSLQFRFAFEKEFIGFLREASGGKNEFAAINAVVIAGHIATLPAQNLLVERLKDERAAVRLAAADGLALTFRQLAQDGPKAITGERDVAPAIGALAGRVKDEADPLVLLACVSALNAATKVPPTGDFPALAGDAALTSARAMGDRAIADRARPELSALQVSRTLLDMLIPGPQQPTLDTATRIMFARFVGDALAHTRTRVEAGSLSEADRAALVELSKRGENILELIGIDGYKPTAVVGLSKALADSDDKAFLAKVGLVIGPGGTLTKPPFSIPAERWAGKK